MLEGKQPTRVVIVEFPDKAAIKAWYNDPGYRPLIAQAACGDARSAIDSRSKWNLGDAWR